MDKQAIIEQQSIIEQWTGRQTVQGDRIDPNKVQAMAATLDNGLAVDLQGYLPPAWHWMFFTPSHRISDLGPDGHARKGLDLPPIDLPRRMWAGGRMEFMQPLSINEEVIRTSTIKRIQFKEGRTGQLGIVTVAHEIKGEQGGHMLEEHDIVYREAPKPGQPAAAPKAAEGVLEAQWNQTIEPSSTLLFRYSALTFNSHRIHYDQKYCQEQEGYPDLVVHGPLTGTLLLELIRGNCPNDQVQHFEFRAVSPLFANANYTVHGRRDGQQVSLWALGPQQQLAVEAKAVLKE